jgi:hypothetical protein
MGEKDDDEVLTGFDQTNGLVDGLEGDDGGAIAPPDERPESGVETILDVVERGAGKDPSRQPVEGETRYSEEGTP